MRSERSAAFSWILVHLIIIGPNAIPVEVDVGATPIDLSPHYEETNTADYQKAADLRSVLDVSRSMLQDLGARSYPNPFGGDLPPESLMITALAPSVNPGITPTAVHPSMKQLFGKHHKDDPVISELTVDALATPRQHRKAHHLSLCQDFRFSPPLPSTANGIGPTDIIIAEVNGDKHKDVLMATSGSDVISVFHGAGDGTFHTRLRFPVGPPGSFPFRMDMADVNGDGRLDVVCALLGTGTGTGAISTLLGKGDGSFTHGYLHNVGGGGAIDIAIDDFNGDGLADVAVALAEAEEIMMLWGDGLGGFPRTTKLPITHGKKGHMGHVYPTSIVAADLNLDGVMDLVVGLSRTGNSFLMFMGLGDGTFHSPRFHNLGYKVHPVSIVVGLFNLDLYPDIATADGAHSNTVSVLLGRGDGTFRPTRSYAVDPGLAPQYLTVGDVNGDCHQDIITANALSNDITFLQGHGDGTFSRVRTFAVDGAGCPGPAAVAVGQLTQDFRPDIVVAHYGANTMSTLVNTCTIDLFHAHKKRTQG